MPTISQSRAMYFPATAVGELPSFICSSSPPLVTFRFVVEADAFTAGPCLIFLDGLDGALNDLPLVPLTCADI